MSIPARISIVTLGVRNVARSVALCEAIGWERCDTAPTRGSFGGITLAINVETADAVDAALAEAVAAGDSILKPGTDVPEDLLQPRLPDRSRRPDRDCVGLLRQA